MRAVGRALPLALLAILVLPALVARPSARQLHDQPLRGAADRTRPRHPRRRHRPGRDPGVPGAPGARRERGRRGLGRGARSGPSCRRARRSTPDLHLAVAGSSIDPELTAAGVELRPGVGGLSTLRLVCVFEAALTKPVASGTQVEFADTSYAGRLGWREIVVQGSGVAVTPVEGELRDSSISDRLQAYPSDRLDNALTDERVVVAVSPGGAVLPPVAVPDATAGRCRRRRSSLGGGRAAGVGRSGRRWRRDPVPLPDA